MSRERLGRHTKRGAPTGLRHEDVAAHIAEYHVGRLSPHMNMAIEAHVRACDICKQTGLDRASSEKRAEMRRLRRMKMGKRRISARGRAIILALLVTIVAQLAVLLLTYGPVKIFP